MWPWLVDVAGRDADAAAAVRILSLARGDDAGAIGTDQPRPLALHGALDLDHVVDGNALGDADDQVQPGIHALKNGVGGKGRRDKDSRSRRAGLLHGLGDGVEDGDLVLEELAAFAGRDPGYDLRAVGQAELGVPRAKAAGDALDETRFGE